LVVLWLLLLIIAVGLMLAQALMIRRIRLARTANLFPEEELLPRGMLRVLDLPLSKPLGAAHWPRARVVVATRDRRFRRVAQFLLARQGFTVELSRNAEAAIELAERDGADVVLIDGSDSLLSAARALRQLAEQQRSIAAVIVSDGEEESPQTLPILPKWGAFDSIVEAIDAAHSAASRA
jgi:CheY-like chemotaxis protein